MKKYTLLLFLLVPNYITASEHASSSSSTPSESSIDNQLIEAAVLLKPNSLGSTLTLCAAIEVCRTAFKQCHEVIMEAHIECEKTDDTQQKHAKRLDIAKHTLQSKKINQNFGQLMHLLRKQLAHQEEALAETRKQLANKKTVPLVEPESLIPLQIQEHKGVLQAKKSKLEQNKATFQENIRLAHHTLGIATTPAQTAKPKK